MQADALVGQGDPALANPDLVPTPVEQRRWTWWSYAALWMGMVHNIYNFTWIGGLVAIGMSVTQAFAIAITGNLIQTLLIGLSGRVGARHGIPFAVWARSAFGGSSDRSADRPPSAIDLTAMASRVVPRSPRLTTTFSSRWRGEVDT